MAASSLSPLVPPGLRGSHPHPETPCERPDRYRHLRHREILRTDPEWRFVLKYFDAHKPSNRSIAKIHLVEYSHYHQDQFRKEIRASERAAFDDPLYPEWGQQENSEQRWLAYKRWEKGAREFSPFSIFDSVSFLGAQDDGPFFQTKVLPLWLCQESVSPSETVGGKGILFSNSAKRACSITTGKILRLAWVSMRRPYPQIEKVARNKRSYTAHYLPDSETFVVFKRSQALLHFSVELAVDLAKDLPVIFSLPEEKLEKTYTPKLKQTKKEKERLIQQKAHRAKQQQLAALEKQALRRTVLPNIAYGKATWEKHFGADSVKGTEGPLPLNIEEILNSPTPFKLEGGYRGKVRDTHLLVWIPEKVNGVKVSLNGLERLFGKYNTYSDIVRRELGDKGTTSHWVLVSKNILEGTRNNHYAYQEKMVGAYASQGYTLPNALDIAVAVLLHQKEKGEYLLKRGKGVESWTYTCCLESVNNNLRPVAIGSFEADGLSVYYDFGSHDCGALGARKFKQTHQENDLLTELDALESLELESSILPYDEAVDLIKDLPVVFALPEEKLKKKPMAYEWLQICSHLCPENIPIEFLDCYLKVVETDLKNREFLKADILSTLTDLKLLKHNPDTKTLSIHKTTQAIIRPFLEISKLNKAANLLLSVEKNFAWDPHAKHLLKQIPQGELQEEVAHLNHQRGCFALTQGKTTKSLQLLSRALTGYQSLHKGQDHPGIATILCDMGASLSVAHKYQKALEKYQEALAMEKRVYKGLDHPQIIDSLHRIGNLLAILERFPEALEKHQEALAMQKRVYKGQDHPGIATILCDMGASLGVAHKYQKALEKCQQALAIQKKFYKDQDHPNIAKTLHNIGFLLGLLGRDQEALEMREKELEMKQRIDNGGHHYGMISLYVVKAPSTSSNRDAMSSDENVDK